MFRYVCLFGVGVRRGKAVNREVWILRNYAPWHLPLVWNWELSKLACFISLVSSISLSGFRSFLLLGWLTRTVSCSCFAVLHRYKLPRHKSSLSLYSDSNFECIFRAPHISLQLLLLFISPFNTELLEPVIWSPWFQSSLPVHSPVPPLLLKPLLSRSLATSV